MTPRMSRIKKPHNDGAGCRFSKVGQSAERRLKRRASEVFVAVDDQAHLRYRPFGLYLGYDRGWPVRDELWDRTRSGVRP